MRIAELGCGNDTSQLKVFAFGPIPAMVGKTTCYE
jgi:hypothetical protein